MYSLHGKLVFFHKENWFNHHLKQTLEPEFYYLYVPYHNQNDLPIFDTNAQPFSYSEMFQNNRFSGPDRVGDANQITTGLKTRFLDESTGEEKAEADLAIIKYFKDRDVGACYGATCATTPKQNSANTDKFSPLAATAAYNFSPNWNVSANWAWNFRQSATASASLVFAYHLDNNHLLNLGYYDVNDAISGITNAADHPSISTNIEPEQDLKQAVISTAWKLGQRWTALGSVDRNFSQEQHVDANGQVTSSSAKTDIYTTFLTGLQYDSCCWAMRVVAYRRYVNLRANGRPYFDNGVFYEFSLKGLGADAAGSVHTDLLGQDIQGFQDTFGKNRLSTS